MLCRKCGTILGSKSEYVKHCKDQHNEIVHFGSSEINDSDVKKLKKELRISEKRVSELEKKLQTAERKLKKLSA